MSGSIIIGIIGVAAIGITAVVLISNNNRVATTTTTTTTATQHGGIVSSLSGILNGLHISLA